MAQRQWIKAAGDRLLNPAHIEQIKLVRKKIVLTMGNGDTRTLTYTSEDAAAEQFAELAAQFAGLDIAGEISDFRP